MRGLQRFLIGNHALLGWLHGVVTVFVIVLCLVLLTPGYADAGEEPSPETLCRMQTEAEVRDCRAALTLELTEAYDRNDRHAIQLLTRAFDKELNILFESGEFEQVVRFVQFVTPAFSNWMLRSAFEAYDSGSPVDEDVSTTVRQWVNWVTLAGRARDQLGESKR